MEIYQSWLPWTMRLDGLDLHSVGIEDGMIPLAGLLLRIIISFILVWLFWYAHLPLSCCNKACF